MAVAILMIAAADVRFMGDRTLGFVDPTGELTASEVVGSELFATPTGRAPNFGVASDPRAALWLSFLMPRELVHEYAVTIREPRIQRTELWIVGVDGVPRTQGVRTPSAENRLRYPTFYLHGAEAAGRVVLIRIETRSSMRGMVWVGSSAAIAGSYAREGLAFGLLFGAQIGLAVYLLAIGRMLRDTALAWLGALALVFVLYAASDRGFLETDLWTGAATLARILSLSCTFLIYATWIAFTTEFVAIDRHRPRLARAARIFVVILFVLAIEAAIEILLDVRLIRQISPEIGLASLAAGTLLAASAIVTEPRRASAFLLCWMPALAGGAARLMLDAVPGLGADPVAANAVFFGTGFSILVFGVVLSVHLQTRERHLRQLAETERVRFGDFAKTASDGFWETDPGGVVRFASGPANDRLGLEPGKTLDAVLAASGGPGRARIGAALAAGVPFRSVAVETAGPAGTVHLMLSGTPATDGSGYRGTVEDVTDAVNRAERQALQQRLAALGQLAGGMAHEINNLLHPIINLGRRVRDRQPSDDDRRQLDIIVDAGRRAAEIVAGVLISVRPKPSEAVPQQLPMAVDRALEAIRPALPAGIELDARIDRSVTVALPPAEVLQVLSNLVANAMHASDRRSTIGVRVEADGTGAALVVEDAGCGMDPETLRRASEPFFTTKGPAEGTGLGLPIVAGLVRGWGGRLDIHSAPGAGTVVTVRLPGPDPGGEAGKDKPTGGNDT